MTRQLFIIAGPDQGRAIELVDSETLVIGRGQASNARLSDPRVSRVHCRVEVTGDKMLLIDAGGSGGTLINGKPIQQHELKSDDIIRIIHRNITPRNILLRSRDKVAKLGDLMLAKALHGSLAQQVTRPGHLMGDVAYMAPERTQNQDQVDGRSDIYGLGATVYALLTGRPPFEGDSLPAVIKQIRAAEPVGPREHQPGVPAELEAVVLRMLARHRDIVDDLERFFANRSGLTEVSAGSDFPQR